jgi:Cu-Zn family superoxide dismutase
MNRNSMIAGLGFAAIAAAACSTDGAVLSSRAPVQAGAQLTDASGRPMAQAVVVEGRDRLQVRIEADGLPPGTYAVHLHENGRCEGPGFESAGGHWNPTSRQHGSRNPLGPHSGDLPNLLVGTDGLGGVEFAIPDGALARGRGSLLDENGAAVVVHAGPDDYRTDPSGNSGARIACGALG